MIFTKATSWFQGHLNTEILPKPRFCYIQDVVNFEKKIFVLTDGLYFTITVFENNSFSDMIQNFSLKSLEIKGSIILLQNYKFVNSLNGIELKISKCLYFGEGSLSSDTKDLNKVNSRSMSYFKSLEKSAVFNFLDQNYIQTQEIQKKLEKHDNQSIQSDDQSYESSADYDTTIDSDCLFTANTLEKSNLSHRDIITESFIQNLGVEENNNCLAEIEPSFISNVINIFSKSPNTEDSLIFSCSTQTALLENRKFRENVLNQESLEDEHEICSPIKKSSISVIENFIDLDTEETSNVKIPTYSYEYDFCTSETVSIKKNILSERTNSQESLRKAIPYKYNNSEEHCHTSSLNDYSERKFIIESQNCADINVIKQDMKAQKQLKYYTGFETLKTDSELDLKDDTISTNIKHQNLPYINIKTKSTDSEEFANDTSLRKFLIVSQKPETNNDSQRSKVVIKPKLFKNKFRTTEILDSKQIRAHFMRLKHPSSSNISVRRFINSLKKANTSISFQKKYKFTIPTIIIKNKVSRNIDDASRMIVFHKQNTKESSLSHLIGKDNDHIEKASLRANRIVKNKKHEHLLRSKLKSSSNENNSSEKCTKPTLSIEFHKKSTSRKFVILSPKSSCSQEKKNISHTKLSSFSRSNYSIKKSISFIKKKSRSKSHLGQRIKSYSLPGAKGISFIKNNQYRNFVTNYTLDKISKIVIDKIKHKVKPENIYERFDCFLNTANRLPNLNRMVSQRNNIKQSFDFLEFVDAEKITDQFYTFQDLF